jgi:hypothetical protein
LRRTGIGLVAVAALAAAAPASASEILTRNAKNVRMKVDAEGRAVVYYTRAGRAYHPLVWGAINARQPSRAVRQVAFRIDYSGGWGSFRKPIWKTIRNACQPYDGPPLPWLVTACKAPDGSYWALQSWQRMLPNLGLRPWRTSQLARELHISHWRGELPVLELHLDWVYSRRFHHLFGRYSYQGNPIHGYTATSAGAPTDTYGRNVYIDTYNSAYGRGWRRENSFLAHRPRGNFCYGFYARYRYPNYPPGPRRPMGNGERYRAFAMGPGVTPVVTWSGQGLPDYDAGNPDHVALETTMNALGDQIAGDDTKCQVH